MLWMLRPSLSRAMPSSLMLAIMASAKLSGDTSGIIRRWITGNIFRASSFWVGVPCHDEDGQNLSESPHNFPGIWWNEQRSSCVDKLDLLQQVASYCAPNCS